MLLNVEVGGSHFLHLADGRGWVFERKALEHQKGCRRAQDQQLVMTEAYEFQRRAAALKMEVGLELETG